MQKMMTSTSMDSPVVKQMPVSDSELKASQKVKLAGNSDLIFSGYRVHKYT